MAKDTFWFTHDYNARNDDKILELRSEFGAEGYGIFWMIVESMANNSDGGVKASLIGGLSLGFGIPKDRLMQVVSFCVKIGLFYEEDGFFFSRRMLLHKNERRLFSEAGANGAKKRWKNKPKNSPPIAPPMLITEHNNTEHSNSNSSLNNIKTIIKGLGEFEIAVFSGCESWAYKALVSFVTNSQKEFELLAMSKPEMKTPENFKLLLQDFVNRIQTSSKYQDTPQLKSYFTNWINDKNGKLDGYLQGLKIKGTKSKMVM